MTAQRRDQRAGGRIPDLDGAIAHRAGDPRAVRGDAGVEGVEAFGELDDARSIDEREGAIAATDEQAAAHALELGVRDAPLAARAERGGGAIGRDHPGGVADLGRDATIVGEREAADGDRAVDQRGARAGRGVPPAEGAIERGGVEELVVARELAVADHVLVTRELHGRAGAAADLDRVVGARDREQLAVGRWDSEAEVVLLARPREQGLALTGGDVPARDGARRLDQRLIAGERERFDLAALGEHPRSGLVERPHAHAAIEARGRDLALVGGEPRPVDIVVVAAEDGGRTVGDGPHAGGAVVTRAEDAAAVVAPLHGVERVGVAAELARDAGLEIDEDDVVAVTAQCDRLAIG